MENGSTLGTLAAYALIVVFLLIVVAAVVRSGMLFAALVVLPFARRRWRRERPERAAEREEARTSAE